jgi:hypothetical protein
VAAKPATTAQQMQKPRRDKLCWWTKDMRNPLVDLDGFFRAVGKSRCRPNGGGRPTYKSLIERPTRVPAVV